MRGSNTGDLMPRFRIIKYYLRRWFSYSVASRTTSAVRFELRMEALVWPTAVAGWLPVVVAIVCIFGLPAPWNFWAFYAIIAAMVAHAIRAIPPRIKIRRRVRSLDGRCCTVCGYDLRGVPQYDSVADSGRCPECGSPFSIAATRKRFGLES